MEKANKAHEGEGAEEGEGGGGGEENGRIKSTKKEIGGSKRLKIKI